jgi:hypothetical protein
VLGSGRSDVNPILAEISSGCVADLQIVAALEELQESTAPVVPSAAVV